MMTNKFLCYLHTPLFWKKNRLGREGGKLYKLF